MQGSSFISPIYEDVKRYITKKVEQGQSWDEITFHKNETQLEEMLNFQKLYYDWPSSINCECYLSLCKKIETLKNKEKNFEEQKTSVIIPNKQDKNDCVLPSDENSCWRRFIEHLGKIGFTKTSIRSIETSALDVLNRLYIPISENDSSKYLRKGMVVGNVQSGKTTNMEAIMALAADYGIDLIIVLTGSIESLRKQTQERLVYDLFANESNNNSSNICWHYQSIFGKDVDLGNALSSLTKNMNSNNNVNLIVCLKHKDNLSNLIAWLNEKDGSIKKNYKVLVIDDEADQASINTKKIEENEKSKINSLVSELIMGCKESCDSKKYYRSMNYICYTATPYANFLNESSIKSLYPSDFIQILKTNNSYIGPQQIFGSAIENTLGLNIIKNVTKKDLEQIKLVHKDPLNTLPSSLVDSIIWFLCSAANLRIIQIKTKSISKPYSMLIHTSIKQPDHKHLFFAIKKWLSEHSPSYIIKLCEDLYNLEICRFTKQNFYDQYKCDQLNYTTTLEKLNDYLPFCEIKQEILDILEIYQMNPAMAHINLGEDNELNYYNGLHICIDNCDNNKATTEGNYLRLMYPSKEKLQTMNSNPLFIVIGGATLSRGLTIEGLLSTYFLRTCKTSDSLMQMGRWFGYRKGYEVFPRIWMSEDTKNKFTFIAELDEELKENLELYAFNGLSPIEAGPRIKNSPKLSWLGITAKNKMQNAVPAEFDFSGTLHQTVLFDDRLDFLEFNLSLTTKFVDALTKSHSSTCERKNGAILIKNVNFDKIIPFISSYKYCSRKNQFSQIEILIDWFKKISMQNKLENWSVIIAGSSDKDKSSWIINSSYQIAKVNRSRIIKPSLPGYINIKTLRSPADLYIDLPENIEGILPIKLKELYNKKTGNKIAINKIREFANLDKTPQLIIYCIDKNSIYKDNNHNGEQQRGNLNAPTDIIGICIHIPGQKKVLKATLTVKIENSYENESEVINHES